MTGLIIIAEMIPITGTVKQGTPSTTSAPADAAVGEGAKVWRLWWGHDGTQRLGNF
jgi:hypothetical protein